MIGRLLHVAIAVPDLDAAGRLYRETFGAEVSAPVELPEHGVTTMFVSLADSRIELLHPLGEYSPVAGFLARNPSGGVHHLCFGVEDIARAREILMQSGMRVLGDGKLSSGARGKPVLFLHPKNCCGTLIELEQA